MTYNEKELFMKGLTQNNSQDGRQLPNNAIKMPDRYSLNEFRHTKTEANISAQSYVESLHE